VRVLIIGAVKHTSHNAPLTKRTKALAIFVSGYFLIDWLISSSKCTVLA